MAKLIAGVFVVLAAAGLWMGMGERIDEAMEWKNRYLEAKEKTDLLEARAKELQSLLGEKSKALLEADERYRALAREATERLASLEDRFKSEVAALASTYELEKVKSYDLAEKVKSLELSLDDQKQALRNVYR